MKITLVRYYDQAKENTRLPSSLNKVQGVLPPLGLAQIAAVLIENNIKVEIIDCPGEGLTIKEFKKRLKDSKPNIVGIGPVMTPALEGVYECAKICKRLGFITLLGGPHLSIYPKETLSHDFIDFGINGESEYVLVELSESLEKNKDPKHIKGLIYRRGKNIAVNKPAIVENLDKLPMPAYHLLPMKKYDSIIGIGKVATIMATRGCPFKCSYCWKGPSDKKYRKKNPKLIADEIEHLQKEYKIEEIMFYDDTLTIDKKYVRELCKYMKKLKIKWETPTRIDCVDYKLLKIMKNSGCIRLRLGVEAGCQDILDKMNKNTTKDQIRKVFKWCKELKIETFGYFIIGYIGEDDYTTMMTVEFAKELNPDYVMFTVGTPLPNTPFWDECVEKKLVDKDYWRNYTLGIKQDRIPFMIPNADEKVKIAYRKFYFRLRFILRQITKINSWDSFKKQIKGGLALLRL